jgi:hypothetical protein
VGDEDELVDAGLTVSVDRRVEAGGACGVRRRAGGDEVGDRALEPDEVEAASSPSVVSK